MPLIPEFRMGENGREFEIWNFRIALLRCMFRIGISEVVGVRTETDVVVAAATHLRKTSTKTERKTETRTKTRSGVVGVSICAVPDHSESLRMMIARLKIPNRLL